MAEYISREKAIKELREVYENEYPTASGDFDEYASHDVPNILRNMKAADVQPIRHGRWIIKGQEIYCSECDTESSYNSFGASQFTRFCPNCGARMDLGDEKT